VTMNRKPSHFAPAARAWILIAVVGASTPSATIWLGGCANQSRTEELEPMRVERQWRRSVAPPQLEVPPPRIALSEGGVVVSFRPSGTIERSTVTRQFLITPTATFQGRAGGSAAVADLDALAVEAIASEYPSLASNAEATIAPTRVDVRQIVLATGSGRSLADLQLSIDPEPARIGEARAVEISAGDVAVVSAKLVRASDPSSILSEGRRIADGGEQRFEFSIASLGEGDCGRLRALLLGEYAIVADCEIRTGAREVVSESRTFAPTAEREWQDPIRRAAKQQLEAIATDDPHAALSMEMVVVHSMARRGEALPAVRVTNVSSRPVLDLRTFTSAFQIREGTNLTYVGSGIAEGEPCLCPGETLEITGADRLDPCGDSIDGVGDGLVAVVSSSGLERRVIGPVSVESPPRFGATLLPPRSGPQEVLLEASSRTMVPANSLEVRLSFAGDRVIRIPFPQIEAGGSGVLRLPADLDADSASEWMDWREVGGRVDVELLEAALWDCEGAVPARQAFRIGR
jgi:hypothetical protein